MPSWQLITTPQNGSSSSEAVTKEPSQLSPTNGHVDEIESKATRKNLTIIDPGTGLPVTLEAGELKPQPVVTNGDCSLEDETACSIAKESNIKSSSTKKRDSKKNDRKPT
jgi:hypothetical protein